MRMFAVDWSGAVKGAAKKIRIAEVANRQPQRLECGRTREQVAQFFIDEAARDARFVVGFDFAFSFPSSFFDGRGITSTLQLWELVEHDGETWLAECASPFWGRPNRKRPEGQDGFRG